MRLMLKAICCASLLGAALGVALPGQASAETFGVVDVRAPFQVKAGRTVPVRASVRIYGGPAVRRTCRLSLRQPFGYA